MDPATIEIWIYDRVIGYNAGCWLFVMDMGTIAVIERILWVMMRDMWTVDDGVECVGISADICEIVW